MNRTVFFAAALLLMPLPVMGQQASQPQDQTQNRQPDRQAGALDRDRTTNRDGEKASGHGGKKGDLLDRLAKSDLRDRLSRAVQRIEWACADDIERFCSDVTPGGGRIASCMDAYSDQLSRSCRFALNRAVSRVQAAIENTADTCLSAVQQQCGNEGDVKACLQQKMASLPRPCQTIVASLQEGRQAMAGETPGQSDKAQAQAGQERGTEKQSAEARDDERSNPLKGMSAFSSDGKDLGEIVRVERGADQKILSVQIEADRTLGLGEKTITIPGNKVEQLAGRIRIMMTSDQFRGLPETKGQNGGAQH